VANSSKRIKMKSLVLAMREISNMKKYKDMTRPIQTNFAPVTINSITKNEANQDKNNPISPLTGRRFLKITL
jgi:hypothetical protein